MISIRFLADLLRDRERIRLAIREGVLGTSASRSGSVLRSMPEDAHRLNLADRYPRPAVADPDLDPPIIWRTKLRSLKDGVDHAEQVTYCVEGGRVGIGWGIEELTGGASLAEVVAAIRAKEEPGWGGQAASTVRLFGEEAAVGDFIWTRDLKGRFRLGRLSGEYRYENSATAKKLDTHQVRAAEWAQRPLGDLEVPGAVIRAFSGTSTSFSRIWNPAHVPIPPGFGRSSMIASRNDSIFLQARYCVSSSHSISRT
jgi:hypothetical protein